MCGRYSLRINAGIEVPGINCELPALKDSYNLCPSQDGIIVRRNEAGELYASIAKWGFAPGWMKDESKSQTNARGETIAEKPMFRTAFRKERCLVLLDGFFEWDRKVKPSQPYFIQHKEGVGFAAAGIWSSRENEDGSTYLTYGIITIGPNKVMEPIHHRMPVILHESNFEIWLNPKTDIETLKNLLVPCPDDLLVAHPVSRRVNVPANNSPDLLRPE